MIALRDRSGNITGGCGGFWGGGHPYLPFVRGGWGAKGGIGGLSSHSRPLTPASQVGTICTYIHPHIYIYIDAPEVMHIPVCDAYAFAVWMYYYTDENVPLFSKFPLFFTKHFQNKCSGFSLMVANKILECVRVCVVLSDSLFWSLCRCPCVDQRLSSSLHRQNTQLYVWELCLCAQCLRKIETDNLHPFILQSCGTVNKTKEHQLAGIIPTVNIS